MDWKRKFARTILERGKYYYVHKYVQGLRYKDYIYKAQVIGSYIYQVEIKIRNQEPEYMMCSCPHAQKGNYCKHMAAVMYAIEDAGGMEQQMKLNMLEKKVKPFEKRDDVYRYFDVGRIAGDLEVTESAIEEAKKMIDNLQVGIDEVKMGYSRTYQGSIKVAVVQGYFIENKARRNMTCVFDRNSINRMECSVLGCYHYYYGSYGSDNIDICKHQLALLFMIDEYLKKYNPGDTTDHVADVFLHRFRSHQNRKNRENTIETVNDFHIEPTFEKAGNELALSLKAGTEKLYVVKNIKEFVQLYEAGESIAFGSKTQVNLAKHRISCESEKIYDFVKKIIKEEESRERHARESYRYYYESEGIKQKISLYGKRLDVFFDLYEGCTVAANSKSRGKSSKTTYLFKEGKPNFSLKITKDVDEEQIFHGIHVSGKVPDFILGEQYRYYFTQDAFCRVGEETAKKILPLMELAEYGDISFTVGRKNCM